MRIYWIQEQDDEIEGIMQRCTCVTRRDCSLAIEFSHPLSNHQVKQVLINFQGISTMIRIGQVLARKMKILHH